MYAFALVRFADATKKRLGEPGWYGGRGARRRNASAVGLRAGDRPSSQPQQLEQLPRSDAVRVRQLELQQLGLRPDGFFPPAKHTRSGHVPRTQRTIFQVMLGV